MGLIEKANALIREESKRSRYPVVAWSGGKDSMLLLSLVQDVWPDVPVIRFRGFPDERKHRFVETIIEEWDLTVLPIAPAFRDVVAKDGHVEIIEAYRPNKDFWLYFPIEAEPEHVPGPESHCAVHKLNEPTNDRPSYFDAIFIGHRGDDVDPVHGAIPLKDSVVQVGDIRVVYPLKDFTETDVWAASDLLHIPQNEAWYKQGQMSANPDYFPLCTKCLEPQDGDTVVCPKINAEVFNLSKFINAEASRERWRQSFVNIETNP